MRKMSNNSQIFVFLQIFIERYSELLYNTTQNKCKMEKIENVGKVR